MVERQLPKLNVVGSIPIARSSHFQVDRLIIRCRKGDEPYRVRRNIAEAVRVFRRSLIVLSSDSVSGQRRAMHLKIIGARTQLQSMGEFRMRWGWQSISAFR